MIRALLLAAALGGVTAADAADDSKALATALAGRVAGPPQRCITPSRVDAPQILSDHILLYRDGARLWRNDLPDRCPGLRDDAIIVTEVFGGQLCRNDQITTLQRAGGMIPGPRCRLGDFVPWDKPRS